MTTTIVMKVFARLTSGMVSLDSMVTALKDLLVTDGAPGMLSLLLQVLDQDLIEQWRAGRLPPPTCCDHPHYHLQDTLTRTLNTSLGRVTFPWRQLRCQTCGQFWVPLRDALDLGHYQRHSAELEQQAIEKASEQSYRQAAADMERTERIPMSKSTIHRWVRQSDCDEMPEEPPHLPIIEIDGMNFHRHPALDDAGSTRGEVRVAVGLTGNGAILGRGAWSEASWEEIGADLTTETGGPRAVALISDGEPGILEGVGHLTQEVQRCVRHLWTNLEAFLFQDGVKKAGRVVWQTFLQVLLAVPAPTASPAQAGPEVQTNFGLAIRRAKDLWAALIAELQAWGYKHAVTYLQNAQAFVFTYVRCWWKYHLKIPRTTAVIESVINRIGQRLKALAQNWSDAGAGQMARIILKRLDNAEDWEAYWKSKTSKTGTVQLSCEVSIA